MVIIEGIREHVISILNKGLSPSITYHNAEHTLDVARQALLIAKEEGITNKLTLLELEIAALYHDTGFIHTYKAHEEKSCEIARQQLPAFGVEKKSIENICRIIMATKLPHYPQDDLQKIICDADLDYLGRNDFPFINEKLHKEFFAYNIVKSEDEWIEGTIAFFKSHVYFTRSSQNKRNKGKLVQLKNLLDIKKALSNNSDK